MRALTKLLDSNEVRGLLGISRPTLRRLVEQGLMPATKVGSQYRFWPEDVQTFLEAGRTAPVFPPVTLLDIDVADESARDPDAFGVL